MQIERLIVPALAHVSYVVASEHEAKVLDPERNIEATGLSGHLV
jgi:hypothetical protein